MKIVSEKEEVVVEQYVSTLKNGFFELWLPRDMKAVMTIEYGNMSNTSFISTYSGDPTCITTTQLEK